MLQEHWSMEVWHSIHNSRLTNAASAAETPPPEA